MALWPHPKRPDFERCHARASIHRFMPNQRCQRDKVWEIEDQAKAKSPKFTSN